MTAFNPATDLPSSINTLEALSAWVGYALATINPQAALLEDMNRSEFVAQSGIIKAADGTNRIINRQALEIDPAFRFDNSKKLWMFTKEISATALPAAFKVN